MTGDDVARSGRAQYKWNGTEASLAMERWVTTHVIDLLVVVVVSRLLVSRS